MIKRYIAEMYEKGRDDEARRALKQELIFENTDIELEGSADQMYEPTESEIDDAEVEYYAYRRAYRYGSPAKQMEYITEHGIDAWQTFVSGVKSEIPKPAKLG